MKVFTQTTPLRMRLFAKGLQAVRLCHAIYARLPCVKCDYRHTLLQHTAHMKYIHQICTRA